ncbi:unnamed protein product, partial [Phaeothamnion confervicola]
RRDGRLGGGGGVLPVGGAAVRRITAEPSSAPLRAYRSTGICSYFTATNHVLRDGCSHPPGARRCTDSRPALLLHARRAHREPTPRPRQPRR